MSPSKFQHNDVTKGVINGPRSFPRISKDSHVIHKPPSAAAKSHGQYPGEGPPVVIYTHSPLTVQVKASEFMTVVQRLTGLRRDDGGKKAAEEGVKEEDSFSDEKDRNNNVGYVENNEITSVLSDDRRFMGDVKQEPMYKMSAAFMDAPPRTSEYFCSARPSSLFRPQNITTGPIPAPPIMDYMKAFQDH